MTDHSVVIVGAGPTGLMFAGELALAGTGVAIVERRASQELDGSRAGGLHSRTIEVLDQRGIADRFLSEGQTYPVVLFNMMRLDISDFPTRHNYMLGLRQNHIERILANWVEELGVPIYRSRDVIAFTQDDTGVDVELSDGNSLRAESGSVPASPSATAVSSPSHRSCRCIAPTSFHSTSSARSRTVSPGTS